MTLISRSIGIIGTGHAVPKCAFKNEDFLKLGLETSDEWITDRTGIKQRYICKDGETTVSLAVEAGKKAIKSAGLLASDIGGVIVATTTPDYAVFPSAACMVQGELGLSEGPAFDLSAACSGFTYALDVAVSMMRNSTYKYMLVIGADTLSKACDWKDRSTVVLFGDGAGAVVLGDVAKDHGILSSRLGARGKEHEKLIVPDGGFKSPLSADNIDSNQRFIQMDGKGVYKFAVNVITEAITEALSSSGLTTADIQFFIPHQANKRIIEFARERLGLSSEQVYVNIDAYGNTSAASIPIALDEAFSKGLIRYGDVVVTIGFGAGLTFGANVIRWALPSKI